MIIRVCLNLPLEVIGDNVILKLVQDDNINDGPNMERSLAHWIRVEKRGFASGRDTPSHVQQFFPASSQMCKPFPSIQHQLLPLSPNEFADVQHISVLCHSFWVSIRLAPLILMSTFLFRFHSTLLLKSFRQHELQKLNPSLLSIRF